MADPTPGALPTLEQYVEAGAAELHLRLDDSGTGSPNTSDGSDITAFLSSVGTMLVRANGAVARQVSARDIDNADDDDLDALGDEVYGGTKRKPASASTTVIYLKRASTGATTIPKASRFGVPSSSSQQPVSFGSDASLAVASGTLKVAIAVTCTEEGLKGNVLYGAITSIVDELPDTGWSIYTPTGLDLGSDGSDEAPLVAGGDDRETNDTYRARLKSLPTDWRNRIGSAEALRGGALEVAGCNFVDVIAPMDGTVVMFCGDVNGLLSDTLRTKIAAAVRQYACDGVFPVLRRYAPEVETVSVTVYMARDPSNYDATLLVEAVADQVVHYYNGRLRSDERLLDGIQAACFRADEDVQDVVLSAPGSDHYRLSDSAIAAATSLPRYTTTTANVKVVIRGPRLA